MNFIVIVFLIVICVRIFIKNINSFTNEAINIDTLSITAARKQLNQALRDSFNLPSNFNSTPTGEEFRQVANGFFQAEGHVSCRIKGKYFVPVCVINQNLSPKSLEFFIILWNVLGRTGSLTLVKNKHGKIVIRLSSESWDTILNVYAKYFSLIYGEKFIAFQKLSMIKNLTSNPLNLNPSSLAQAIQIVYSLAVNGNNRKLSLSEQLALFGISQTNSNTSIYTDNFTKMTILFIIGFILGDGTLFLRIRNSSAGSIWLIPTLLLPQLKNKYNDHFFTILTNFFKSLDINTFIINNVKASDMPYGEILNATQSGNDNQKEKKDMTTLKIESIYSIFEKLLPVMKHYSYYFYWKYDQYELMSRVALLVNAKAHFTLYGFKTILEIIFSYTNNRALPKDYWIDIIESWFKAQANMHKSGENNIQAVYGIGTLKATQTIIAWKCVFPKHSNLKSRQFGFTNEIEAREALKNAIKYRDNSIKSWVDSLK